MYPIKIKSLEGLTNLEVIRSIRVGGFTDCLFPFHIWDVIRNPLTNSIIFPDGKSCTTQPASKSSPRIYPLEMTNSLLLKIAIEIVDFPIKNGDFP